MAEQIRQSYIMLGCDPEIFFKREKRVVGSESVLPKDGLKHRDGFDEYSAGKIVIDGVQGELNPTAATCRQSLAYNIANCFKLLKNDALDPKNVTVNFAQAIELSDEDMEGLSDKSKTFGCSPSKNVYSDDGRSHIEVNPHVYKHRAAGGHIHLGVVEGMKDDVVKALRTPKLTIPLLDLIVGNTCVLLDRDPSNVERRKVYGKAGEHRVPTHGLEYRTPSNFWLRSYPLMSLVMGLARTAVCISASSTEEHNFAKELFSRVRMSKVVEAINKNDFDLAYENFKAIEEYLMEITPEYSGFPLTKSVIKQFHYFVEKGVDHWFKDEPMEHWINISKDGLGYGFESFMSVVVDNEMGK